MSRCVCVILIVRFVWACVLFNASTLHLRFLLKMQTTHTMNNRVSVMQDPRSLVYPVHNPFQNDSKNNNAQIPISLFKANVNHVWSSLGVEGWLTATVFCVYLRRRWGGLPVSILCYSEGGWRCQGDNQDTFPSQHRPVSPALLVLHARLWQDWHTKGNLWFNIGHVATSDLKDNAV